MKKRDSYFGTKRKNAIEFIHKVGIKSNRAFLELSYALNIFEPLNVKNKTKCYNFANSISMVKNPHLT